MPAAPLVESASSFLPFYPNMRGIFFQTGGVPTVCISSIDGDAAHTMSVF